MNWRGIVGAVTLFGLASGVPSHHGRDEVQHPTARSGTVASVAFAGRGLPFESNAGQWDPRVRFGARLGHGRVFITDTGPRFSVAGSTIALDFGPSKSTVGEAPLPGKANYFIGDDPSRWRTGVSTFATVRATHVAPGIDLVYRGAGADRLEYDLVFAPHAAVDALSFRVSGGVVRLRADGALEIRTGDTALIQHPPRALQRREGDAVVVGARFRLRDDDSVGFEVDAYDPDRELVVDPLVSSTYLGGSGAERASVAVDSGGSVYVAGFTTSPDFPIQGGVSGVVKGTSDAFVTKLAPSGSSLVYSTYVGGSADESGATIAVDGAGAAYVAGVTYSADFPIVNPFQSTYGAGADAFVLKLAPSGAALAYSTYLRGTTNQTPSDAANAIAVDASGSCYVAGVTLNSDFPTTAGSLEPSLLGAGRAAFVAKFVPSGNALAYSTFIGSAANTNATGVAIDATGAVVVTGDLFSSNFPVVNALQTSSGGGIDSWVAKLNPAGSAMLFSTYLGGSGTDLAQCIALDPSGRVYVAGSTLSPDFPTVSPFQFYSNLAQGFVSALASDGSSFIYSTYLEAGPSGIAVDGSGRATVVGGTGSAAFPPDLGAFQSYGGQTDAFVLQLKPAGNGLIYASFLGAAGQDSATGVALDGSGLWIAGTTESTAFPTLAPVQGAFGGAVDTFLARVTPPSFGVAPSTVTVPIFGAKQFTAFGGSGIYGYSMQSNPSGGSINPATGIYTAGNVLNVSDVVKATDSLGASATATVNVVTDIGILPKSASLAPLDTKMFGGSGGTGGYTFSMASNPSGGTVTSGGLYKAGPTGNVTDVVRVTDAVTNTTTAAVTVGPALTMTPTGPTVPPLGVVGFTASGGALGYVFSFVTNASGGTLFSSGYYQAGATPSVDDVVKVVDSNGAVATTTVHVGAGLTVAPANPKTPPTGTIAFSATGGSGSGYTWSLLVLGSGTPTIDPDAGVYMAGSKPNAVDQLSVRDDLSNGALVNISVGGGIAINPAQPTVPTRGSVQFIATGGSESGQVWSITANQSGATIDPKTGEYVAGATGPAKDTVRVVDSLNLAGSVDVEVGASLSITPPSNITKPGGVLFFVGSGGSGAATNWAVSVNGSGGTIDSAGRYVAGARGPSTDILLLTDSLGNSAIAVVSVTAVEDAGAQPSPPPPAENCSCRVGPAPPSARTWLVAAVAIVLVSRIRRRRPVRRPGPN